MTTKQKIPIAYVTSNPHKVEENKIFVAEAALPDGTAIRDLLEFRIRNASISEILEVDLRVMVQNEVTKAYSQIKVPCIVEHAGLIFDDYAQESYPGGLTKPMWNTLGDRFLVETHSQGRLATARAAVAYCDGYDVHTFVGETKGRLSDAPRGSRAFYWDTVFVPDDPSGVVGNRTYAEVVEDPSLGLRHKVLRLSQSTKAMLAFAEYLTKVGGSQLWA